MACVWRQCSKALCQTKLGPLTPTLPEPHLGQQCGVRCGSLLLAGDRSLPISSTRAHSSGFPVALHAAPASFSSQVRKQGSTRGRAYAFEGYNTIKRVARSAVSLPHLALSYREGRICVELSQEGQSGHCKHDQTLQSFARQLQYSYRGPLLTWHRSLTAISRTASALLASSRLLEVVRCLLLDRAPR